MKLEENSGIDKLLNPKLTPEHHDDAHDIGADHDLGALAELYVALSSGDINVRDAKGHHEWAEDAPEEVSDDEVIEAGVEPEIELEKVLDIEEQDIIDDLAGLRAGRTNRNADAGFVGVRRVVRTRTERAVNSHGEYVARCRHR